MADEPATNNHSGINENEPIKTDQKPSSSTGNADQQRPGSGQTSYPGGRRGGGYRTGGVNRPVNYKRSMHFRTRHKVCAFCVDRVKTKIDWKNVETLRRFVNDNGSIRARRKTGTCAKHQRRLAIAIKRARHLALLPYTNEHVRLAGKS